MDVAVRGGPFCGLDVGRCGPGNCEAFPSTWGGCDAGCWQTSWSGGWPGVAAQLRPGGGTCRLVARVERGGAAAGCAAAGCGSVAVVVALGLVRSAGWLGVAASAADAAAGFGGRCCGPVAFGVDGVDAGASGCGAGAG